ncbi:MAG: hypothetical protein RR501_11220, partial [Cloacibacillus sp.]
LECSAVCENCADVCPNRANAVVTDAKGAPQVIHLDPICNECGNCESFCPWSSAPYKDKFTFFADEKSFCDSSNSGWLPLGFGCYAVRLNGKIYKGALAELAKEIPSEITGLITAAQMQLIITGMINKHQNKTL